MGDLESNRLIRVPSLFQGAPYSYASVAPSGRLVFTAGACPLDGEGHTVAPGDIAAQARQCLVNLRTTLAELGLDFAHVLKTTVYVASRDRADLVTAWSEVEAAFGSDGPPSTLLGVAALGYANQLVEVEAVALDPLVERE